MTISIRYLCFLLIIFAALNSRAQSATIKGKVTGGGSGISAASITLLQARDSAWVRSELSDDNGSFTLKELTAGKYIVMGSAVGYKSASQAAEVKGTETFEINLLLEKETNSLAEVAVTARKPFIEMSLGKMVVNIEGTTTTGATNVIELMRRLPGVTVDGNGAISMQGKEGVLVLIDDRQTYLSGEDIAEYLKSISADETGQIELITQPGAKYDAAGNNGIINIKLRKNKRQGWNGSVSASYGMGVYFHRSESLLLNYKKNKLSLSLSGSDMEAIGFADWQEHRYYLDTQTHAVTGMSSIHSTPKERFANTAARLTADYDWTEKTKIGVSLRGSYHPNVNRGHLFVENRDYLQNATTYNVGDYNDGHYREDLMANAYLSHKFNKESSLDINFDYLVFRKHPWQDITTTTYDAKMQAQGPSAIQNLRQPFNIDVYSIKADYNAAFKNGVKLEAGWKSSFVTTNAIADVRLMVNNVWVRDTGRSNHFLYKENINALYINGSKSLGEKWEARVGLRAEETRSVGAQYTGNLRFNREYVSLFPTAFLSYKANKNNQFELNYGRRIDRPGYNVLNPFVSYTYQNLYNVGNPYLMPMYSNNIELKHSYKDMLITSLSCSSTDHLITDLVIINDKSKIAYYTTGNNGSNSDISLGITFARDLIKWWSFSTSTHPFLAQYTAVINNKHREVEWGGYSLDIKTQIDLGKGWKTELFAYYVSAGRWSITSTFDANMYMECGVSKKVNEKILVKFFANDPFYVHQYVSRTIADNYLEDNKNRFASQLFSLSLTYNFGGSQSAERNGSIDEASRIR